MAPSQPSLPRNRVFVVQFRRQPRGRVKGDEFEVSIQRRKKMNAHTSTIERAGAEMERLAEARAWESATRRTGRTFHAGPPRPPRRPGPQPGRAWCRATVAGAGQAPPAGGGPLGVLAGGNSFTTAVPVVCLSGSGSLTRQIMLLPFTALSSCGHTPESCTGTRKRNCTLRDLHTASARPPTNHKAP